MELATNYESSGTKFLRSLFQIILIPQAIYYYPGITLIAQTNIKVNKVEDLKDQYKLEDNLNT